MIKTEGVIYKLSKELKWLIAAFVIVLSIGFLSGLLFVEENTNFSTIGIEEHYLGNEMDEDAEIMKFKKSDREMLTLFHNHVLSMSILFFLLGLIVSLTRLNKRLKLFLIVEPFVSVLLTFGGLCLLWKGLTWMKYIVIFSGSLMTLCFVISVVIILYQLMKVTK